MAKYRKKPVVIEAEQWNEVKGTSAEGYHLSVGYFRHPDIPGTKLCEHCGRTMHDHGWIDTLEGGHNVCPGDWIITGVKGERYPCKPDIFALTYEVAAYYPPNCKHTTIHIDMDTNEMSHDGDSAAFERVLELIARGQ